MRGAGAEQGGKQDSKSAQGHVRESLGMGAGQSSMRVIKKKMPSTFHARWVATVKVNLGHVTFRGMAFSFDTL
jgi:hypothetical protein